MSQISPRLLAYQGPISRRGTTKHTDCGEPNQSLGWIVNQEKSELTPTQVFRSWATNTT